MRILTIAALPCIALSLCASELDVAAPIRRVRIHPDEAWVTRVGRVTFSAPGSRRVRIVGLPAGLKLEEVRVSLRGPEGTRLGNVSVFTTPSDLVQSEDHRKLEARNRELGRTSSDLFARQMALDESRQFLAELKAEAGGDGANRPAYAPPAPAALLELMQEVQARQILVSQQSHALGREANLLSEEQDRVAKAMERLKNQSEHASSGVIVEVGCGGSGEVLIDLQTRTREARWKPSYEARLSQDRKALDLACYAVVSQLTGEDWKDVQVEIANAQPSKAIDAPAPRATVNLGYRTAEPVNTGLRDEVIERMPVGRTFNGISRLAPGVIAGGISRAPGPGGTIQGILLDPSGKPLPGTLVSVRSATLSATRTMLTDRDGAFRMPLLPTGTYGVTFTRDGFMSMSVNALDVNEGEGVSFAQVVLKPASGVTVEVVASAMIRVEDEEPPAPALESAPSHIEDVAGLSRTYALEGGKDIPSDAQPRRFAVASTHLAPELRLRAVPRQSPEVFILASIRPDAMFPWFPGAPVAVFRAGERLGQLALPSRSPSGPARFGFGPLPGLRMSREILEARTEPAGPFSRDRAWVLHTRTAFVNEGDEALDIEVLDPALRTTFNRIQIEPQKGSTPVEESRTGIRTWTIHLGSKGSAEILDHLRIRAPREGHIPELGALGLPDTD